MPHLRLLKTSLTVAVAVGLLASWNGGSIAQAHPEQKNIQMASQEKAAASVDGTANEAPAPGSEQVLAMAAPAPVVVAPAMPASGTQVAGATEQKATAKPKSPWAFPVPDPVEPSGPMKRIVIDPGHGGTNEGAVGVAGIHEKYLTLQVALLLADKLRREMPDVEIILTRDRDTTISLVDRIERANELQADLFLSLHFNSSKNPDAVGFESFWSGDYWRADLEKAGVEVTDELAAERTRLGALGYRLADGFNRAMRHRFDVLDRGVKPGDFTVLTRAKVPAVVLEMAFLSHADEGISTTQPKQMAKLVDAIAEAIRNYAPLPTP